LSNLALDGYAKREKVSIKYQLMSHKTEFLHRDTIETSIVPLTDWYLREPDEERKLYPPLRMSHEINGNSKEGQGSVRKCTYDAIYSHPDHNYARLLSQMASQISSYNWRRMPDMPLMLWVSGKIR
jgi:hypothetical protein